jgi:hypothetical protein
MDGSDTAELEMKKTSSMQELQSQQQQYQQHQH